MSDDRVTGRASDFGSLLSYSGSTASLAFPLLVLMFLIARLWGLGEYALTGDEVFSLMLARLGWSDMLAPAVRDVVHPPLFYVLLKVWVSVGGESRVWLRMLPALTSCASIVPLYLLCRELGLRLREINLVLALVAVNGYLIFYAHDVRMYSLLTLTSAASLWLFVRFVNIRGRAETSDHRFVRLQLSSLGLSQIS